jgi:GAF domain-containing protein
VRLAAVNCLDADRDGFQSRVGKDLQESPRATSFCIQLLVVLDDVLVSEGTTNDERFAKHPLVVGPPYFRFYAAAPIRTPDGAVMGTVCAYDFQPRKVAASQMRTPAELASAVTVLLEKRPKD